MLWFVTTNSSTPTGPFCIHCTGQELEVARVAVNPAFPNFGELYFAT